MLKKSNREQFNDGILVVCKAEKRRIVQNIAQLRYGLRTIGVKRFYEAKIADQRVDKLVSVPINPFINAKSIVMIGATQYEVAQVQEKYDTQPPTMYISLSEPATKYTDERV